MLLDGPPAGCGANNVQLVFQLDCPTYISNYISTGLLNLYLPCSEQGLCTAGG